MTYREAIREFYFGTPATFTWSPQTWNKAHDLAWTLDSSVTATPPVFPQLMRRILAESSFTAGECTAGQDELDRQMAVKQLVFNPVAVSGQPINTTVPVNGWGYYYDGGRAGNNSVQGSASKPAPISCCQKPANIKEYHGFVEKYKYCTVCNKKTEDLC